jgi:hypothetical protein
VAYSRRFARERRGKRRCFEVGRMIHNKALDATVASCHIPFTGNRADLKRAN